MPERKEIAPGQLEDGSFDLSDTASEVEEEFFADGDDADSADETADDVAEQMSEDTQQLVEELQASLAEAIAARQRALADYANYQRRATENEQRIRCEAICHVIRAFLPLLDHVALALGQDAAEITTEQLMDGVGIIQAEFKKTLDQLDVVEITPEPGEEFDPNCHQAVLREPTDEQEPNTIVTVLQPGFSIDEVILRPATVSVAAPVDGE
ncbi:MAG: nucleotide exchange factor GrpE [Planctomycetes bacterium]|nr:nucleotide exchange factor GrpE [Planctomycetota bacterium]